MFGAGVEVCLYGDATECTPTAEAAAFARMVNLARSGGHCEGLVVRAAELFAQAPPVSTALLVNDGEVTHGIIRSFATQLFSEVRTEAADWADRDLADIVSALEASLADGSVSHTMGLYTQSGGHSVLPYSVSWRSGSLARIAVYDPNWPSVERHVDVDIGADRWTFSFDGADPGSDPSPWTGGAGTLDLVSLDARDTRRCPFCGEPASNGASGTVILVRSAGSKWSVRTRNGVLTAGAATEVAGSVRPVRAEAGAVRDHLVDLPADAVLGPDARVTLEIASAARLVMLMPTGIVEVDVAGNDVPVSLVVGPDTVSTTGGAARVSVARGILGLAVAGTDIVIDHSVRRIDASYSSGGIGRGASVTTADKVNDPALLDVSADLPSELVRPTDFPRVVPQAPGPPPTTQPSAPETPGRTMEPARIDFDLSEWTLPDDDPASYGFVASDVIGGRADETQICRSIACLRRRTVWIPRGGFDPRDGSVLLSPYEFVLRGVAVPVEIRCGRRGPWIASGDDGTGHAVSCRLGNVTGNATIRLRPG